MLVLDKERRDKERESKRNILVLYALLTVYATDLNISPSPSLEFLARPAARRYVDTSSANRDQKVSPALLERNPLCLIV